VMKWFEQHLASKKCALEALLLPLIVMKCIAWRIELSMLVSNEFWF
jgi:hypothetical protein